MAWLQANRCAVYTAHTSSRHHTVGRPIALFRLALEGIVSFSSLPLKLSSFVGAVCATCGLVYGFWIVARTAIFGIDLPGYASLITVVMFFNGIILLCLAIVGEYLSRVFVEVKDRPIYLVREELGDFRKKVVSRIIDRNA